MIKKHFLAVVCVPQTTLATVVCVPQTTLYILFSLCLLLSGAGKAQVSYGGTPYSLGSNFRASALAQTRLPVLAVPPLDMVAVRRQVENTNCFATATYLSAGIDTDGLWQTLPTGDRLWRLRVALQGEEVHGMRLFFDDFYLPEDSKLFIYSPDHQILLGAFTSANNKTYQTFATTVISSKEVIIEYLEPASQKGQARLHLHRIDQAYKHFEHFFPQKHDKLGFGASGDCNLNINCTNLADAWHDEQRGVVRIITVSSTNSAYCTGSLIANTAKDNKPYILTANHCLKNTNATHLNSWSFDFNYEIINCNAPNIAPNNSQSITGSTLKAKYDLSDFALLELQQNVPTSYNALWNSWDRSGNNIAGAVCIHHPSGDVKKITIDTDMNTTTSYYDDQPNDQNYFKQIWNHGTTEGGSSGSPLFSTAGNIIGQLRGGGASCSAPNSPDWYGKFSVSWTGGGTSDTRLSDWLDPIGSGVVVFEGLPEDRKIHGFYIYPNPAPTNPYLAYQRTVWGGQKITITIYDMQGKLAYQLTTTLPAEADKIQLETTLPKGIYNLQIKTARGSFEDKLIIM